VQPSGTEVVLVWIAGVAGLGDVAWQSRDLAGLCRPGQHGPEEWRSCMCGSLAW
jgi:hypothetical protein